MKHITVLFLFLPLFLLSQKKEIPFKTFNYNPSGCNGFQAASGSLIFIPDNAFQFDDGSECQEKILIKYREFHSQSDMFYSGLNMLLEKDGKVFILESAGMFEIQAWCGDKKLKLKNDKTIQVRMKTRRNPDNLMSFIYNNNKNVWLPYNSKVIDFSFFEKNNKADSSDLWGSTQITGTAVQILEGDEIVSIANAMTQLPEGFFKGMNIKNLGIFNYDAVIKDSLAVPMQPEFVVNPGTIKLEQKLYVMYENINSLIYYSPDDFKERFVLLKTKGIRMFTEFKDGSVACLKPGSLNEVDVEEYRNKTIQFVLEKQALKPKNENELSKITGLNTK